MLTLSRDSVAAIAVCGLCGPGTAVRIWTIVPGKRRKMDMRPRKGPVAACGDWLLITNDSGSLEELRGPSYGHVQIGS